jgi:short-subunit dehydrogenase
MKDFRGITALITGASSGIGAEIARQLASHAKCLILVARRRERLETLGEELLRINPGLTIHSRSVDLSDRGDIEDFGSWIVASGLEVDLLVNNAGLGDRGDFVTSDWWRIEEILDVNIGALTRLTHMIAPRMRRRGHGAILNISSVASLLPVPGLAVYAASKSFVTQFSEALRVELRDSGVSVTAVCPGPVETEFSQVAARKDMRPGFNSPEAMVIPVEQVAREALRAVANDEARRIPGLLPWFLMSLTALVPLFLLRFVLQLGYNSSRGK